MRAFRHAIDLGYRYLETDVHLTRDGVLVAFHDSRLDRVTDAQGRIADLTWEQVATARIDGTDPIPRLDDLVTAFPDAMINIDPKADRCIEALASTIREHELEPRVCVTAFSRRRTRRVKVLVGPALCTGGGALATLATMVGVGRWLLVRGVDVLQVPVRVGPVTVVSRRFVERAHRWGLQVHVWTIDDPSEMERLLDLGVDAIMTDEIAVLADVFRARGLELG
jgi:glycerophosphoryl diester phosphodiesterase